MNGRITDGARECNTKVQRDKWQKKDWVPTPEQIAAECQRIQSGWTDAQWDRAIHKSYVRGLPPERKPKLPPARIVIRIIDDLYRRPARRRRRKAGAA